MIADGVIIIALSVSWEHDIDIQFWVSCACVGSEIAAWDVTEGKVFGTKSLL